MLGTVPITEFTKEDEVLREVARDMNREDTFQGVNVGVYFGDPKTDTDPYFKGLGPMRRGCTQCAGCMIGCRHNSKNVLTKNYLYFAEKFGAEVIPETLVTKIEFKNDHYLVHTQNSTSWFATDKKILKSKGLIVSGGVLGTLDLLIKQKHKYKTLERLSNQLGQNVRTNSKSVCGVAASREKLNNTLSITSVFEPDDETHIEIVKYPDKSDGMRVLATMAAGKGNSLTRTLKLFGNILSHPLTFLKMTFNTKWATNSVIVLVMQAVDSAMEMVYTTFPFPRTVLKNKGEKKVPSYNERGQEVSRRYAEKVGGIPANAISEVMFNMSTADHILGGCPMGTSVENSVVNKRFEVHGYPNMYILDGSIMPCNPGVNPSFTITALTEYAMSLVPEKEGNQQKSLDVLLEEQVV